MAIPAVVRNLIKLLHSATVRQEYASGWDTKLQALDRDLIRSSRTSNISTRENMRFSNSMSDIEAEEAADKRLVKKPVEVVNEILAEIPTFKGSDLKKQVAVVSKRIKVLTEQGVVRSELENEYHSLAFLKARQVYPKVENLFKWPTTNQAKVEDLLKKYKLHIVEMSQNGAGVKNIPQEAIDEIEKYAAAYAKVVKKGIPEYRLIVDEPTYQEMQKAMKKKDPILLALSPFGNWYYILGAWDKEVEYVDDLIYNGK